MRPTTAAGTLTTIRKAGVSTGCRSCPNDGDCELQQVVERVGISEIGYPVAYRGLEAEHDDPFFDRDYNLCILCGRCVRMCHEVRGASVLSFKYRGPRTLIGPAFGTSHVAAGCEFCGACVSVCPTGALADKVSKWDGKPDGIESSTCPFCALGCRVELAHKDGALSSVRAAHDVEINDGQLCLRGRFCLPEATHHYSRTRQPMLRKGPYFRVASWDEALDEVAARLAGVAPDDMEMLVSADLANEGLYAAQRFARARSGRSRRRLDGPLTACPAGRSSGRACSRCRSRSRLWLRLRPWSWPVSIPASRSRWPACRCGVPCAAAAGSWRSTPANRTSPAWPSTGCGRSPATKRGRWPVLLRDARAGHRAPAAGGEDGAGTLAVVIGPRVFDCPGADELLSELEALAARPGVSILPLAHGANVRGALELGALSEVLPGPRVAATGDSGLARLRSGRPPRVLYLVGEAPFATRPDCELVIAQDLYLPPFEVDVFLPAASFAEAEGTLTSIEGRVQELRRVEYPPAGVVHGVALPDWRIFSDLAGRLGRPDLQYSDDAAVRAAIRAEAPGFPDELDRRPRAMTPLAHDDGAAASAAAAGARAQAPAAPTTGRPAAAVSCWSPSSAQRDTAASTSPPWSRGSASCIWKRGWR